MKLVLKSGWSLATKILPKNRFSDRILLFVRFIISHKRLPTNKLYFNDVLYRIKTSDEILRPERTFTSDKELVKLYVKSKLDNSYNIPTVAVLKSEQDIFNFKFPDRCVIKPTHSSGRVILRKFGEALDLDKIACWLSENYYEQGREANYRYLTPKIIIEEFVFDSDAVDDIKFFCFKGKVRIIQWDFDRHSNHTRKLYDRHWNDLGTSIGYPLSAKVKEAPKNLDKMIDAAELLSSDFEFVRVDFYTDEEKFFCGELTHLHGNADEQFYPKENEELISKLIFHS